MVLAVLAALGGISLVGLLVGLIIAALVFWVCSMFLPPPVPLLLALLVVVVVLLGGVSIG
jgi:hypothetical protein